VKTVVVDSSVLMGIFQYRIDVELKLLGLIGPCEIVVPSEIESELVKLSTEGKGKEKKLAKAALTYIAKRGFRVIQTQSENQLGNQSGKADQAVMTLARELSAYALTSDIELAKKMKANKIQTISITSQKRLIFFR
jgi:rRNA-processing protein FCF1